MLEKTSTVVLKTRFGEIAVGWAGEKLREIRLGKFGNREDLGQPIVNGQPPGEEAACLVNQLADYFAGKLVNFSAPLDMEGHTNFQRRVWGITRDIPYGDVRTYGWIARRLGEPKGARAVGGALGRNPLPILVPCHRVIGCDGSLVGFSSGLDWKRSLLKLEGVMLDPFVR